MESRAANSSPRKLKRRLKRPKRDAADVTIAVIPTSNNIAVSERFTVAIQIQAGMQQVDGGAAYLDFNPKVLRVTEITPGDALPFVLQNHFDNEIGQINIAAGTFNDYPTGTFDLAYIELEVLQEGVASSLAFHFDGGRHTDVTFKGNSVLGNYQNGSVNGNNLYLPITR